MKKIITCTGYGTTGSSVVTDLLKEFDDVSSLGDYEYRFLFDPNGVKELEIALKYLNNRQNSDFYIKQFLKYIDYLSKSPMYKYYEKTFDNKFKIESEKFISNIIEIKWDGYWHRDIMSENIFIKSLYYLERAIQKKILKQNESSAVIYKNTMYYSYYDEKKFVKNVKEYLNNLILLLNKKENFIVFDQLVPPENIKDFSKYFDDIKVIIVDRDPRDIYTLEKFKYKEKFGPYKDLNSYIEWHKLIRKSRDKENENENVLVLNFEDFIYFYEETVDKLLKFLSIEKEKWIMKKKYFNPDISKKNTKVWEQYSEIKKEIEIIETELSDYLYSKY
ncbi:hypothetical protein [Cetobacterium sp. 2G large]|uniref:hypothetical protein n=1 Tax=Cetobacterium sp. 2G large TaxID=2759680 RepID=UPI00163D185F|nr:hypothetical protein [Cetobacterium sp. 2G large]MBC2852528.1 hypothetical protein [Cetobacterium sp. 2G large]